MKKIIFIVLTFSSLSVLGKPSSSQTLATVKFYKDGKNLTHQYEILKTNEIYTLVLKEDHKTKKLSKEQALDLQSDINGLVWKFEYKDKKPTEKCKGTYASLSSGEDSTEICNSEVVKVETTFSLLNRLNSIIEKK